MSAQPSRHLQPVDEAQPIPEGLRVIDVDGAILGDYSETLQRLQDEVAGLQRDVRGWSYRYGELKRDKDAEAQESPVWPAALRVFDYWKRVCKHPRSEWTLERFELIRPHLMRLSAKKRGRPDDPVERLQKAEEICMLAVDGIVLDCFVSDRANGTKKRHDGWHLIFGDKFEERCNSAPLERIREVMGRPDSPTDAAQARLT